MLVEIHNDNRIDERVVLRSMFEARKRVFIDLLGWDIPALDDKYEVDHFDVADVRYLVLADADHRHMASARLLPTTTPAILDSLFPDLCEGPIPSGETVYEITRFCLSPDMRAPERRLCRNKLVTALVMYAQEHGIDTYTGVAELPWLRQILDFGWDCRMLGEPRRHGKTMLGAMRITISDDTLSALVQAGVYADPCDPLPIAAAA
jgi:N-acyl-L-homoserine lactone synthetase